jgi:cytochrome P450
VTFLEEFDAADPATRVDLVHRWIGESASAFFAELRRSRPMLQTPGPVVVTRYADVQEVLSRETDFSVRLYAPKIDACVGPFMLSRDATVFNERDKSVMKVLLRPDDLPAIAATTSRLAEAAVLEANGRIDVVAELTRKVPVQLCGEYFGFPGPDLATMMRWSRAANLDMFGNLANDAATHQASIEAGIEMSQHVDDLVARRRADPGDRDDVLGRLLRTWFPDAIGFDDERIRANTMFLLIGGVETVSATAIQMLTELLGRPEQLAAAQQASRADDVELLGAYLWEAVRLNPTFQFLVRYCERDYTLARGTDRRTTIPAGTAVYAAVGSAMLDDAEVDDPESFRLDRPAHHRNLHFGYGHHLCLCYQMSLVELPAMLAPLLRRPGLQRADGPDGQVDTAGGPFPERLVLEYDPPAKSR